MMFNLRYLSWALLFGVVLPLPAQADLYEIGIVQTDAASGKYLGSCEDTAPLCVIDMRMLRNGREEKIQALASFRPGGVEFRFERNGENYAVPGSGDEGFYIPLGNAPVQARAVTLYTSNSLLPSDSVDSLLRLPVQRLSPDKIAELEITIVRSGRSGQKSKDTDL